jgi:non-heme chloroperoxidase
MASATQRISLALATAIVLTGSPIRARAADTDSRWQDKSPHKSAFITVNGVKLHYLDWRGQGETILFLHGLGDTAHIFDDLAPKFTNHFRVLGLSWRGHGQSEKPATGYDTATLVEDIRQFLDALKIERVILAGHSIAGDQLTRFAGVHPERVIKLVYLDAAHDRAGLPEIHKQLPPELFPSKVEAQSPDGLRGWITRMSFWSEAWEANLREMFTSDEKERSKVSRLAMQGTINSHPDYAKVKAPALNIAVVGFSPKLSDFLKTLPEATRKRAEDASSIVKKFQEQEIDRFRNAIPNGRVVVLNNTDHHCFIQKQDEVVREMQRFLIP